MIAIDKNFVLVCVNVPILCLHFIFILCVVCVVYVCVVYVCAHVHVHLKCMHIYIHIAILTYL